MVLECCLQCLNSGSNASGISQLVSVENSHNSINANAGAIRNRAICNSVELEVCTNGPSEDINGETGGNAVLNRLFVNVGDGTLRYCMENKIKLSQVSCIIITSLCPHNIAGFPGVFLSLSDLVRYY